MKQKDLKAIAHFIYETGILNQTPRSGLWFLGSGKQSIAEHLFRVTIISYALAHFEPRVNKERLILMALFHDFSEARTSDLNHVHQRYGRPNESEAIKDLASALPFGDEIDALFHEANAKQSLESLIVKDADTIDWIALLREEEIKGNMRAKAWITIALKRLRTTSGKQLGQALTKSHPDDWWFDAKDKWWINRKESDKKWKKK